MCYTLRMGGPPDRRECMSEATGSKDSQDREERPSGSKEEPVVPPVPDPPARHEQDTQPVEGEDAIHPPPEQDLVQRGKIQG
jgi:hypothetical protein